MGLQDTLRNLAPRWAVLGPFPSITANQAGKQTVSLAIAPSRDYLDFYLDLGANVTLAMIQEIRLKAKNKTIQVIDGTNLDFINQFDKVPGAVPAVNPLTLFQRRVGIIGGSNIFNSKQFLYSGAGKDLSDETSLNCGSPDANGKSIDQVSIEIDLVNTGNTPIIQASALWYPSTPGGAGTVRRLEKKSPTIQTGRNTLTKQDFLIGDVEHLKLNRLVFVPPAGVTLDNWLIRYMGNDYWVRTELQNEYSQAIAGWRVSQAANGVFILDFSERGYGDEYLDISSVGTDLQVEFDASGPGLLVMFQDSFGLI